MKMDARAVAQGLGRWQQIQFDTYLAGWAKESCGGQHHAAGEFADFDTCEIERGALTGDGFLGGGSVHLYAAHPQLLPTRVNFQLVVLANAAGDQSPGNDGAESLHGEDAVNRKAQRRARIFRWSFRCQPRQLALEFVESFA